MTELIQDIHEVSLENGLKDIITKHTYLLKKKACRRVRKFYWILYCWQKADCLLQLS